MPKYLIRLKSDILDLVREKGLIPVVIIILIALVVSGYFLYSNYNKNTLTSSQQASQTIPSSKNETANWKTYFNKKYGYSIQYPAELSLKEPITDEVVTFVLEKDKGLQNDPEKFFLIPTIGIFIFQGKTIEDQVTHFKSLGKEAELKEVELAGNKAYRAENINVSVINSDTTISEISTTVSKNNNLFILNIKGPLDKYPELVKVYNQMLSTFQLQ